MVPNNCRLRYGALISLSSVGFLFWAKQTGTQSTSLRVSRSHPQSPLLLTMGPSRALGLKNSAVVSASDRSSPEGDPGNTTTTVTGANPIMPPFPPHALRYAVSRVCRNLVASRRTRRDWKRCSENRLWYELAACILSSRVPFEQAVAVARHLQAAGVLDKPPQLAHLRAFEQHVFHLLSQPLKLGNGNRRFRRYRFPLMRANHLTLAAQALYANGGSIRALLQASADPRTTRKRLVSIVPGMGPKQASMFLRNIGYTNDLAVLDSHILRYLSWIGVTSYTKTSINTLQRYECLEAQFRSYADHIGLSVGDADLAAWIVVRVVHRGFKS